MLAAVLCALAGCGGPEARSDFPPPGQVEVISVTRLEQQEKPNLIQNGEFETWWDGAAACEGFYPPSAEYATVKHVKLDEEAGYGVAQSWTAPDKEAGVENLFRTEIPGATAGTSYRIDITAGGAAEAVVRVGVWERRNNGDVVLLDNVPIALQLGSWAVKHYSGEVMSKEGGTLILAAHCDTAVQGETTVQWYDWRLSADTLGF